MQVPCDAHFACQSRCSVISRDTDISGKVSYWILISYQPHRVTPEDEQTPSLVSAHLKLFSIWNCTKIRSTDSVLTHTPHGKFLCRLDQVFCGWKVNHHFLPICTFRSSVHLFFLFTHFYYEAGHLWLHKPQCPYEQWSQLALQWSYIMTIVFDAIDSSEMLWDHVLCCCCYCCFIFVVFWNKKLDLCICHHCWPLSMLFS